MKTCHDVTLDHERTDCMNHFPHPVAASAAALLLFVAGTADAQTGPAGASAARGKYLVTTSGCMDCHTPWKMGAKGPEPDMSRWLSGHPQDMKLPAPPAVPSPWSMVAAETNTAWAGPWGVSFTANLTPDEETGLGRWTAQDFKATIRTGRHLGRGREILPPMPIPVYNNMTDEDLEAMFAYLRTIPPVRNKVPEPLAPR
jgi:mono/diheme cytochrome c family protein